MQIAVAQFNAVIGDLAGNVRRLLAAAEHARDAGADLLVTPELAICGYPPRDLLDRPAFVQQCIQALAQLIEAAPMPMLVGAIVSEHGNPLQLGERFCNGAVLMNAGSVVACYRKQLLPNYDIFDEERYFAKGDGPTLVRLGDTLLGINICEDIWADKEGVQNARYARDPMAQAVSEGAELIINLSASPYDRKKPADRLHLLQRLAKQHGRPILYVNQVGAHDSVVFDGRSMAIDCNGEVSMRAPAFAEALVHVHYTHNRLSKASCGKLMGELAADSSSWEEDVCRALTLGLSDYVRKTGFNGVLLGLSGGIDSALVAAIAVLALGPARVRVVAMPSRFSSEGSLTDARALAENLKLKLEEIPIEPMVRSFEETLAPTFAGRARDLTEENLQARVRGVLLMAISNKFGPLLLTTGNKSEIAVGYTTLYGDMNGGLGVISDLYKTEVYALAHHLNAQAGRPFIPESTLTKAPSAELRENQADQDSLPPYEELDALLRGYVDETLSVDELAARGFPRALVERVAALVQKSEYKRRQMAPGLRVSRKAFGEGRRLPLAQRWFG